jgi:hypothetical protein
VRGAQRAKYLLITETYNINNPDHIIRTAGSHHIHSAHSIMASAKAFEHLENGEWKAVEDMLSKGSLRKADSEEHHGVR